MWPQKFVLVMTKPWRNYVEALTAVQEGSRAIKKIRTGYCKLEFKPRFNSHWNRSKKQRAFRHVRNPQIKMWATSCKEQCSGSVTFWYGSGSGDPYLWLTDSDSALNSSMTFKTSTKKFFSAFYFLKIHYIILQR